MIFSAIRSGKHFNQLDESILSPVKLVSRFCFRKAAVYLDVNCDRARKSLAFSCKSIYGIDSWKTLTKTKMSSSLEALKCGHRFNSNVSSLKEFHVDDTCLSLDNGDSCTQDSTLVTQDQSYSASVQSTPDIERKYVHHVYDAIAPHFSSTRFAKWPKVAAFLNSLAAGSVILDAGCGNGKYLGLNPTCFYIGCDISSPLIQICAERGHEVVVADAVNLPYRSEFGDAAISIAVLHHLSTENRRRKAIEELIRVVRKGGLVLITVWAVEQEDRSVLTKWTPLTCKYDEEWIGPGSPRARSPSTVTLKSIPETEESSYHDLDELNETRNLLKESVQQSKENIEKGSIVSLEVDKASRNGNIDNHQEYFVPWHLPYHRAEIGGASTSALANGFAKKDDKKGAVVYNRYYHVFIEGELERLVSGVDNAVIHDKFYDKSNWCIVLEKT